MIKLVVFTTGTVYRKLVGDSDFLRELIEGGKSGLLSTQSQASLTHGIAIERWLIKVDERGRVTIDESAWEKYLRSLPQPPD